MRQLALALMLGCSSCTFMTPSGEELTGIPVEEAAVVLRGVALEIELWDLNANGLIDGNEYVPLGLAVTARLLVALSAVPDVADETDR